MGLVQAIKVDLTRLHEAWMELFFPRQRGASDSPLGKWTPNSQSGWIAYRAWGALGVLAVGLLYPLVLFGYLIRFQAVRLDSTATRLGIAGVLGVSVLVWGALTVLARIRFDTAGFIAVAVAALVATLAAGAAVFVSRAGRRATIAVAYPLGMTAIFLPPVVAALYSPTLAEIVFPGSESIAKGVLDSVGGAGDYLRSNYELTGPSYVGMWLLISVPMGWLLGGMSTLADVVRPAG